MLAWPCRVAFHLIRVMLVAFLFGQTVSYALSSGMTVSAFHGMEMAQENAGKVRSEFFFNPSPETGHQPEPCRLMCFAGTDFCISYCQGLTAFPTAHLPHYPRQRFPGVSNGDLLLGQTLAVDPAPPKNA